MLTKRYLLAGLVAFGLLAAAPAAELALAIPSLYTDLYPTDAEPLASGWAEWDWDEVLHHPRVAFTVHVQDVYSTDIVAVLIHHPDTRGCDFVGLIRLTDGSGDLVRDSSRGERVPDVSGGDDILIVDGWTDILLVWGVF